MNTPPSSIRTAASLIIALVLSYGLLIVFYPFLLPVATGGIIALISRPFYDWIHYKSHNSTIAASITMLLILAAVAIPLTLLGVVLVREISSISGNFGEKSPYIEQSSRYISDFFASFGVHLQHFDARTYALRALDLVRNRSTYLLSGAFGVAGSTFITLISCFYLLQNHEDIHANVIAYSPLSKTDTSLILTRAREVLIATIRGNLVLTVLQSLSFIASTFIFGVGSPVLLGILYGIASFVPTVGTGLVWLPVVLYELSIGRPGAAIGIAAWSIAQVILFDNFLGPRLIEQRANLHPFLILMGVLGGIAQFGILGLILGPTIVALGIVGLEILRRSWQIAE